MRLLLALSALLLPAALFAATPPVPDAAPGGFDFYGEPTMMVTLRPL
jgi:hypothetical protein